MEFIGNDKIKWLGNSYGGFFVDVSLIHDESNVISVGIGEDISFDIDVINYGAKHIYMFDPTPKSKSFIKELNLPVLNYSFYELALSSKDSFLKFYLPKNDNYVSGSLHSTNSVNKNNFVNVKCLTIGSICKLIGINKIDILKIDIEGAEYEVIEQMIDNNILPIQLCVEFHNRFFLDGYSKFEKVSKKLILAGYEIMGISESNEEYLFVLLSEFRL